MVKYQSYRAGSTSRVPKPKTVGRKRKRRTTKYGEPIRKFNKKDFRLQNKFAYKKDAKDYKKRVKEKGYLAQVTPFKGGHKLWVRDTPKSRKWEKELLGKPLKGTGGALAKKGGSLKKALKQTGQLRKPSKKKK